MKYTCFSIIYQYDLLKYVLKMFYIRYILGVWNGLIQFTLFQMGKI
jgi:hypothetical protein